MEVGFALTILAMALSPALTAVVLGLNYWDFKNPERAYGIALIGVISIEMLLFRVLFQGVDCLEQLIGVID